MSSTTVVKDPGCGMKKKTAIRAGEAEYKGKTYHFCGSMCKEKSDLTPAQHLGKSAKAAKSSHDCCS